MVDRLVVGTALAQTDQDVGRILADRNRFEVLAPAEIALDGFAHEFRNGHAAPLRLELEVLIGAAGESEVGRHVGLHRSDGIAVPEYRQASSMLKYVR